VVIHGAVTAVISRMRCFKEKTGSVSVRLCLSGERQITCGDPQEVNQQNITEPFGLSFISPPTLMKASFQRVAGEINNPADGGVSDSLRREGDSNPRYGYPYGSLANCWFKPLTHRSFI
jgi:hypothetical protein